jgi:hypothetical protein
MEMCCFLLRHIDFRWKNETNRTNPRVTPLTLATFDPLTRFFRGDDIQAGRPSPDVVCDFGLAGFPLLEVVHVLLAE